MPKFEDDQFWAIKGELLTAGEGSALHSERLGLIPTAEVPLTNLVRESILDEKELPMRLTALTPCFRAEAGAAGRDTRGMIRQHQFSKVELVSHHHAGAMARMSMSGCYPAHEEVLKRLDLHYRVMTLCAGDMGFSAPEDLRYRGLDARPGRWRSIPRNFQLFAVRRFPGPADGRPLPRAGRKPAFRAYAEWFGYRGRSGASIAVMETYQQQDGSIAVPEVLRPYMGGLQVVARDS